jgi:hypothetical protein
MWPSSAIFMRSILRVCCLLGKERNLIGHGVWMWTNENRPLVVWHSKFLESANWVGAEYYDWSRFENFMRKATVLMNTFAEFKLMLVRANDSLARANASDGGARDLS